MRGAKDSMSCKIEERRAEKHEEDIDGGDDEDAKDQGEDGSLLRQTSC